MSAGIDGPSRESTINLVVLLEKRASELESVASRLAGAVETLCGNGPMNPSDAQGKTASPIIWHRLNETESRLRSTTNHIATLVETLEAEVGAPPANQPTPIGAARTARG